MFPSATSAKLQEIGPRFTLKLRWLRKGLPSVTAPDGHASIGGDPADEIYGTEVGPSKEEIAQDELDEEDEALKEIGQPAQKKNVYEGTEVPPLDEEQEYEWKWKVSCSSFNKACYMSMLMVRFIAEDGSIEENLLFMMQNWSSYRLIRFWPTSCPRFTCCSASSDYYDIYRQPASCFSSPSLSVPSAGNARLWRLSNDYMMGMTETQSRFFWGITCLLLLDTLGMNTILSAATLYSIYYARSTITLWTLTPLAKGPSWRGKILTFNATPDVLAWGDYFLEHMAQH